MTAHLPAIIATKSTKIPHSCNMQARELALTIGMYKGNFGRG